MQAGKLRHQLEIQKLPDAPNPDSYSEPDTAFSTIATRRAAIEPLTGRETWLAQHAEGSVDHKITIRYFAGLTPQHRFRWKRKVNGIEQTRIFNIVSVMNPEELGYATEMVVACKERV